MKAVTLWQPYASAVAEGIKTSETRSWAPPENLIGQRIAIHASLRVPRLHECPSAVSWQWALDQPRGVVVATVRLVAAGKVVAPPVDCRDRVFRCRTSYGAMFDGSDDGLGDYRLGRWVWLFDGVEPLDPPVPARGMQRIWNWDSE